MSAQQKQLSTIFIRVLVTAPLLMTNITMAQPACPERFHTIPVMQDAKFCQQFDDKLPASLSFYSDATPQTALVYYLEEMSGAQQSSSKGRQLLQSPQGTWVIVISADGEGSQVDILVKADEG